MVREEGQVAKGKCEDEGRQCEEVHGVEKGVPSV